MCRRHVQPLPLMLTCYQIWPWLPTELHRKLPPCTAAAHPAGGGAAGERRARRAADAGADCALLWDASRALWMAANSLCKAATATWQCTAWAVASGLLRVVYCADGCHSVTPPPCRRLPLSSLRRRWTLLSRWSTAPPKPSAAACPLLQLQQLRRRRLWRRQQPARSGVGRWSVTGPARTSWAAPEEQWPVSSAVQQQHLHCFQLLIALLQDLRCFTSK